MKLISGLIGAAWSLAARDENCRWPSSTLFIDVDYDVEPKVKGLLLFWSVKLEDDVSIRVWNPLYVGIIGRLQPLAV